MQFQRVAVGVDFSEPSTAAARWVARDFAAGAELVLVHAVDIPRPPGFLEGLFPAPDELVATAVRGAETRLRELGATLAADRIWTEVRVGRPADQILTVAAEMAVDAIAVGEHGRRRGIWSMLGSTAEQLVRRSTAPVLLARGLPDGPPREILAPVDESPAGDDVLRWARLLAERFGGRVTAFHALPTVLYGHLRIVSSGSKARSVEEGAIQETRRWLGERLVAAGFDAEAATAEVAVGSPSHEIIAAAERLGADLIVLGSRGAGAVGRALIGSVASAVLRGASSPVFVVPAPEPA